jgi:Predicted Zn-dependent proteases and their inactivated homologs
VTNFFVDPSPGVSPLDLLGSVSRGLYAAVLLERPDVDLAADRFRIVVAGYAVEKGRATERVSEAAISGRLSEFLRGVSGLGDDLKFAIGGTGSIGSPTLLVPRWKTG